MPFDRLFELVFLTLKNRKPIDDKTLLYRDLSSMGYFVSFFVNNKYRNGLGVISPLSKFLSEDISLTTYYLAFHPSSYPELLLNLENKIEVQINLIEDINDFIYVEDDERSFDGVISFFGEYKSPVIKGVFGKTKFDDMKKESLRRFSDIEIEKQHLIKTKIFRGRSEKKLFKF